MATPVTTSNRKQFQRASLAALAILSSAALLVVIATRLLSDNARTAGVVLFGVALGVSSTFYWIVSWRVHTSSNLMDTKGLEDFSDIVSLVPDIELELHFSQIASFVESIVNPQARFERITEVIEPRVRRLRVSSAYTFQDPPTAAGRSIVVPLMLQRRGALIDGLEVTDTNNVRISTLGKEATLALELAIVRSLVTLLGTSARTEYLESIEAEVTTFLCSKSPSTVGDLVFERIVALEAARDTEQIKNEINRFIRRLRLYYPIAVICECALSSHDNLLLRKRQRITVERLIASSYIPESPESRSRILISLRDALRRLLGVRPAMIAFPLANADRSSSYHVQAIGRDETYLARQSITDDRGRDVTGQLKEFKFRRRFGQRSSHLYIRKGDGYASRYLVCNYFERMPGSLGGATMSALGAMVLIVIAGLVKINGSDGQSPDLVAVILSFPAIAGTWLGFQQTRNLYGGVLMARVSLITTVVIAMVAAAYYAAGPGAYSGSMTVGVLGRSVSTAWMLLSGIAVVNFLACSGGWLLRANVESHFVKRSLTSDIGS